VPPDLLVTKGRRGKGREEKEKGRSKGKEGTVGRAKGRRRKKRDMLGYFFLRKSPALTEGTVQHSNTVSYIQHNVAFSTERAQSAK